MTWGPASLHTSISDDDGDGNDDDDEDEDEEDAEGDEYLAKFINKDQPVSLLQTGHGGSGSQVKRVGNFF